MRFIGFISHALSATRTVSCCVGILIAFPFRATAQIYSVSGNSVSLQWGQSVVEMGDITGDGVHDMAVGAPSYSTNTGYRGFISSSLRLLSNENGTHASGRLGFSAARLQEFSSNSNPAILFGSPQPTGNEGAVIIMSGSTGNYAGEIFNPAYPLSNSFGYSVASAGDVNNDGIVDYLVGAPAEKTSSGQTSLTTPGALYVISGATGFSTLYVKRGDFSSIGCSSSSTCTTQNPYGFGTSVTSLGDVNGDGRPDFAGITGFSSGFLQVFSGSNSAEIYNVQYGTTGSYTLSSGNVLSSVGDLNGDGKRDLLIGVPSGGTSQGGYVEIRSGADGAFIRRVEAGLSGAQFGAFVRGVVDLDGDGVSDFLVGAPAGGYIRGYSGSSGAQLFTEFSPRANIAFGTSGDIIPDISGDGVPDLAVGAPLDDVGYTDSGTVFVFAGRNPAGYLDSGDFTVIKSGSKLLVFPE